MYALNARAASRILACATEACWRQWSSLAETAAAPGGRPVGSVIDPEALVLLSLAVRQHERRLEDRLRWWTATGTSWMSIQRLRSLLVTFPERVRPELARFAAMAVSAGDPRWKVFVADSQAGGFGRSGKGPASLHLSTPSALMLRLRAGFGVGAKADILTFLLASAGAASGLRPGTSAETIANATSYSVVSTRRAASEMSLARFVTASEHRPAHYSVDVQAWAHVLRLGGLRPARRGAAGGDDHAFELPAWRFWAQMFAFLAACTDLGEDARLAKAAPVVQASATRDLAERFRRPLEWNGIEWVDPRQLPGVVYLEEFGRLIDRVIQWIGEAL